MADENPTGRGAAVALDIPVDQARFLSSTFRSARAALHDELREYPEQLKDPARLRREEAAYGRLLVALDKRFIVPDADVRFVLSDLAQVIDDDNEYSRVVAEHEALHGLLAKLEGSGGEGR
jgi:hypothetical protein